MSECRKLWLILLISVSTNIVAKPSVQKLAPAQKVQEPSIQSKAFLFYDKDNLPRVIYMPYPSSMDFCQKSPTYFFPIYPDIFMQQCPPKSIVSLNQKNEIVWNIPNSDEWMIGASSHGLVFSNIIKQSITIISPEKGELLASIPFSSIRPYEGKSFLKTEELPTSALYDKNNQRLYVYFADGLVKKMDLKTNEITSLFKTDKQFLSQLPVKLSEMNLDSSGRFLIYAQNMSSRLNSWAGFGVYDLKMKKEIYTEKLMPWSWEVLIATGVNNEFSISYTCSEGKINYPCVVQYKIHNID